MAKPEFQNPSGTRDFSPGEIARRRYIFNTIIKNFELHGYQPIETPAFENLDTLLGKYGDEGDKLLFRILNSGDFLSDLRDAGQEGDDTALRSKLNNADPAKLARLICDRGLRYDLTVPFARYVVQHRNDIVFPFKRYQIQPVWRADKPQKGRYREFYQCDVDVIGSNSLLNERELIEIALEIFGKFGIDTTIRLNNRKILTGIAEKMGEPDKLSIITSAIDKLDKIGFNKVMIELENKGINPAGMELLESLLRTNGSNEEKLIEYSSFLSETEKAGTGIDEMKELLKLCEGMGSSGQVQFDISLARGLEYYTGTIIEVSAEDGEAGSICGGGRYDDLTGVFGMPGISGVGISFGVERIYDHMERLGLFPGESGQIPALLFVNFGGHREKKILNTLSEIRKKGIVCEFYPDAARLKKQFSYADSREIPYVAILGEEEEARGLITLKDMGSGEQRELDFDGLIAAISSK